MKGSSKRPRGQRTNRSSSPPSSPPPRLKISRSPRHSQRTGGDTASASPSTPKKIPSRPKRGKKRVIVKTTPRRSKWNAETIITDAESPLASADLRSILSNPSAWDILEAEEKAEIVALFPDEQHVLSAGSSDARLDMASLMNDDSFRHDCARYTENLSQGRHDPEWLTSAWSAHERRKIGEFDEYLENKFTDEWEAEVPEQMKPVKKLVAKEAQAAQESQESHESHESQESQGIEKDEIVVKISEDKSPKEENPASKETETKNSERPENDVEMQEDTDELQLSQEAKSPVGRTRSITVTRQSTRMDIDGGNKSEDELA